MLFTFKPCCLKINSNLALPSRKKKNMSTTTMLMATKLDRRVINHEGLLHIKLHDTLIMWSCKKTWQTKNISFLPWHLCHQSWQDGNSLWWAPAQKITWLFDHVVLEDQVTKLKTYLHYHGTNGHQTRQGGDIPWVALTRRVTWPYDHVVFQNHATN